MTIIENIQRMCGIGDVLCESAPDAVARGLVRAANGGDRQLETFISRIADEAVANPTAFPIGNGDTMDMTKDNIVQDYINRINNALGEQEVDARNNTRIQNVLRTFPSKIKSAIAGKKNDKVSEPTAAKKPAVKYQAPTYHGWGY